MTIAKNRAFSLMLIFTLLVSLLTPTFASANNLVKGDPDNPRITIIKHEKDGDDTKELEGVTFKLTQTHSFNPETDEWTEVTEGVEIEKTTDENGEIVITKEDGLELGRYEVEETDGPPHVILNPETIILDIPMTSEDGKELYYDITIEPKNEVIRGDAELIKKDEEGNVLEGIVFGLYSEDGTLIEELTTDAEGKISAEGLDIGKYYFQELETLDGLAINTDEIWFEVKSGEQNKVEWTPVEKFVNENGEVINYEVPDIEKDVEGNKGNYPENPDYSIDRDKEFVYNITIKTPGDIEKYKTLGVTDTLDDRLEFITDGSIPDGWKVTGADKGNINFVQNGQELKWSVDDLSLLEPNTEIKITFTAKIKPDAVLTPEETGIPNEASLEFDNDRGEFSDPEDPPTTPPVTVDPTEGSLKVIKVDKDDNTVLLPGAEFKLTTDEAGNNVVNAEGTIITVNGKEYEGTLENLTTRKDGTFTIEGLTPGTYYLHETKAPTYDDDGVEKPYNLLTKPVKVTIVDNETDYKEYTVENSKSGWELPTTGGIGTILFTLIGLALMGIAVYAYIRRREPAQE